MKRGKKQKQIYWYYFLEISYKTSILILKEKHTHKFTHSSIDFFLSSKRKTTQNNTHLSCDINLIEFEIACLCSFDCG